MVAVLGRKNLDGVVGRESYMEDAQIREYWTCESAMVGDRLWRHRPAQTWLKRNCVP